MYIHKYNLRFFFFLTFMYLAAMYIVPNFIAFAIPII